MRGLADLRSANTAFSLPPADCSFSRYTIAEFIAYHHAERPHLALGNLPPGMAKPPDELECLGPNDVIVRERLDGLLRHYERKAA